LAWASARAVFENHALVGDLGKDVIAGAVENTDHGADPIAHQRFPNRFYDGHAAAHAGLISQVDAVFGGGGDNRIAVLGQQGLVGGNHMLALGDGIENQLFCDSLTADGLHNDIHRRIGDGRGRIRYHHSGQQGESPVLFRVDIGHIFQIERASDAVPDDVPVVQQQAGHTRTHRAAA
jgi:hypothetical protein